MITINTNKIEIFNNMLLVPVPKGTSLELLQRPRNDGKRLRVRIDAPKQKRSLQANSYCWVLCQAIAEAASSKGDLHTREDVYRKNIKELFAPVVVPIADDSTAWIMAQWKERGIGWIAERIGETLNHYGYSDIAFWVGSSQFNTEQMSRLIEGLTEDAKALGVSVISEADKALLLQEWKPERG